MSRETVVQSDAARLAVAMWDFSWLVRRAGTENEYRDWESVLAGLAERGYNCVRMDAFPHLVAAVVAGRSADTFHILPQRKHFPWGNHVAVEVSPLRSLVSFIKVAKKNGLRVGLSSWFNDDENHLRHGIRTPEELTAVWSSTLGVLAESGLLDNVAWVDLCNEFPLGEWLPGAYKWIFGRRWPDILPLVRPWKREHRDHVEAFYKTCIPELRRSFPELRYTFSMQRVGFENLRWCDVRAFDLAEVHVWLAEVVPFTLLSGHLPALLCMPGGLALHRAIGPSAYKLAKTHWIEALCRRMDDWASWARENGLPLHTTEGWGPINYQDAPRSVSHAEWRWVKEVCAEAAGAAVERGWRGVCTSNFCQPHFPGMWNDAVWHKERTRIIIG